MTNINGFMTPDLKFYGKVEFPVGPEPVFDNMESQKRDLIFQNIYFVQNAKDSDIDSRDRQNEIIDSYNYKSTCECEEGQNGNSLGLINDKYVDLPTIDIHNKVIKQAPEQNTMENISDEENSIEDHALIGQEERELVLQEYVHHDTNDADQRTIFEEGIEGFSIKDNLFTIIIGFCILCMCIFMLTMYAIYKTPATRAVAGFAIQGATGINPNDIIG